MVNMRRLSVRLVIAAAATQGMLRSSKRRQPVADMEESLSQRARLAPDRAFSERSVASLALIPIAGAVSHCPHSFTKLEAQGRMR